MHFSIVVPCYNEEEVLPKFIERVTAVINQEGYHDSEVILVDDGSADNTWQTINQISQNDSRFKGVKLSRNFGHQLALSAGLSESQGEKVFVCDADLQDPPELLIDMNEHMTLEGADVVYGMRNSREGETRFKKMTASVFYRLLDKLSDVDMPLDTGDCRLMKKHIVKLLGGMSEHDKFIRGMIAWLGFKQVPFVYNRDTRAAGETKYTLGKMIAFATDAIIGFSMLPLRFSVYLSMVMLLLMGVVLGYTVFSWLFLESVPGWASTMLVVSFIAGIQFLILGVIGEYIGRLYIQNKERPLFIISERSEPSIVASSEVKVMSCGDA